MNNIEQKKSKKIRSYVLRQGRMTKGQQLAIEKYWSLYGMPNDLKLIDIDTLFPKHSPVVLEIGFGMGHSLITMAEQNPNKNYLGIEVHQPGIGWALQNIASKSLTNIKIFHADAIDVLTHSIPEESLSCVQLFFPDPWPKKRHHKRRIVQSEFIQLLHKVLKVHGIFHVATDWGPYSEHIIDVINKNKCFINLAASDNFITQPNRPLTKFEVRGKKLGHNIWDEAFVKIQ